MFYGADEGFVAVDSSTGKRLWQFNTNQNWRAGAMTYAVDGTQYVAVAGGSNVFAFSLCPFPRRSSRQAFVPPVRVKCINSLSD